jgi:signal transduction histidine kinase
MNNRPDTSLTIDWLISHLRWPWLILALLIGLGREFVPGLAGPAAALEGHINLGALYVLLGAGVTYNLLIIAFLALKAFQDWTAIIATILDTSLAVGILIVSGEAADLMLPVALFPVITSAIRLSAEAGLLTALVLALAIPISVFLAGGAPTLLIILVDVLILFGAAALSGSMFQQQLAASRAADQAEIRQLRRATERARAVYDMASTLGATLDYQRVLTSMIDLAFMALSEVGERHETTVGMVLLVDEEGAVQKLRVQAGRNLPRVDEQTKVTAQNGILRQALYTAETVITNDLQHDPLARTFVALQNCVSAVCTPLRAGFDIYGAVLFASTRPQAYTQEHGSLLTTFCNQATISMQNAQLYDDVKREQRKLLEKDGQARNKLARDLHDGPTQDVSAIAMRLDYIQLMIRQEEDTTKIIEELRAVEDIALRTTNSLRNTLFTLRPVVLETQGLSAALAQYAQRLREIDNLNILVDTSGYAGQLSSEIEGMIFAVVEEAVSNAKKHANADKISVRVKPRNGSVVTDIIDNGTGFDVKAVRSSYDRRGSMGLLNMDERAKLVGGRFDIKSAPGQGTTVRIEVPTVAPKDDSV